MSHVLVNGRKFQLMKRIILEPPLPKTLRPGILMKMMLRKKAGMRNKLQTWLYKGVMAYLTVSNIEIKVIR